jgi:hypothetical protein
VLNLQIAKAYLAGTDNGIATRTWQQAIESLTSTKQGAKSTPLANRRQRQGFRAIDAEDHH